MTFVQVVILAIVQGLAELLPVSSSAHVVVTEKLLGLDPSTPQMTLVLVMLHTGTMFAVIAYFWSQWKRTYFATREAFLRAAIRIVWATVLTGVIGEAINKIIEKTVFKNAASTDIEQLFGRLDLVAPALAMAGVVILIAGLIEMRRMTAYIDHREDYRDLTTVTMRQAGWIGAVQGLCLPFRGFSRSGATISTGMLVGASKERAERFSFALAVVLTPAAAEGEPRGRRKRHSDQPSWSGRKLSAGSSLLVPGRPGGAEVAEQLAGEWEVVPLRHLLPAGRVCRSVPSLRSDAALIL